MATKELTSRLYHDIKKDFEKLSNIKEFGVQKYALAWIFAKIGDQYYKSPKTIENIVFSRTQYQSIQTNLFATAQ